MEYIQKLQVYRIRIFRKKIYWPHCVIYLVSQWHLYCTNVKDTYWKTADDRAEPLIGRSTFGQTQCAYWVRTWGHSKQGTYPFCQISNFQCSLSIPLFFTYLLTLLINHINLTCQGSSALVLHFLVCTNSIRTPLLIWRQILLFFQSQ